MILATWERLSARQMLSAAQESCSLQAAPIHSPQRWCAPLQDRSGTSQFFAMSISMERCTLLAPIVARYMPRTGAERSNSPKPKAVARSGFLETRRVVYQLTLRHWPMRLWRFQCAGEQRASIWHLQLLSPSSTPIRNPSLEFVSVREPARVNLCG